MKRAACALLLALLTAVSAAALGEIGFAEVKKNQVNMRQEPGGKTVMQIDRPQSVFVTEEIQKNGYLWCHVYTFRGKNTVQGWIRGDMLRFVSDEFTDVVSVQAGDHYVTGVRSDGTVAILGDDMPHLPCIDTVRTWRNVDKTASYTCSVYALTREGELLTVGRNNQYTVWRAADISGDEPVLLDADGYVLAGSWPEGRNTDVSFPLAARGIRFVETAPIERTIRAGLTKDGQVLWFGEDAPLAEHFSHGPYTDIDMYFYHFAALRADGRVDAAVRPDVYMPEASAGACAVEAWEDVVQIAAGVRHTLGLRRDGTVYYAGDDSRHRAQVESWTDVVQVEAGNGYSIALRADGSVVMAGAYTDYER